MKRVMSFENHFSKQYFGLCILIAIFPMRKLRLWEMQQFTLAKIFCGSRQGINKIGKLFLKISRLATEGAVLHSQSSLRNFSLFPWSPLAPSTVVCIELQSHVDVPLPDHINSNIKLKKLKKVASIQHSSTTGHSDSTEVWRHEGISLPAKQPTRTWISQIPTMNSL